jgi:hypothetical protein
MERSGLWGWREGDDLLVKRRVKPSGKGKKRIPGGCRVDKY